MESRDSLCRGFRLCVRFAEDAGCAALLARRRDAKIHQPAASKAGIRLKGWHTLRHYYTTLLRQHNDDRKVVQDLLRHANYRSTAEVYDSAVLSEKRTANSKVVRLVTRERTAERTAQSDQVAVTA